MTPQTTPHQPLIDPDSTLAAALVASAVWLAIGVYDTLLIEAARSAAATTSSMVNVIGPGPRLLKHLALLPLVLAALWRLALYARRGCSRPRLIGALLVYALAIGLAERFLLNFVNSLGQSDPLEGMTLVETIAYWTSEQGAYLWFRSALQNGASFLIVALALAARAAARRALATQRQIGEAQVSQLNARLAAAENELSPHFLFNSLHFAVARTQEAATRALLVDLAELLRYVLHGRAQPRVTLDEEVQFTRDYLALCERQGARVVVRWEVAEAARHALLPRMLLHMLVENAYRHAAEVEPAGAIGIVAAVDAARLRLTIDNDCRPGAAITGTGIGLSNARERLQILYGERARLDAGPSGATTWRTSVEVPLEQRA